MTDDRPTPSPWAAPNIGAPPPPAAPIAPPAATSTPLAPPVQAVPPVEMAPTAEVSMPPLTPPVGDYITPDPGGSAKGGKGKKIVAAVAAVAVLGAGGFAVVNLAGGSSGGASSPEAAVQALLDAASAEDMIGVMDAMAPSERSMLKDPIIDVMAELQRLEVLSPEAKLDGFPGIDIVFSDVTMSSAELTDGISLVEMTGGTSTASGLLQDLPLGDLLIEQAFDGERPEGDFGGEADTEDLDGSKIVAIEQDGGWYVSLWYSVAEAARIDSGKPKPAFDGSIKPVGADTPEDAIRAMVDAGVALDLERVIGLLPPAEYKVLYDYMPLVLDEANDAAAEALSTTSITIDDMEVAVTGSGDRRLATIPKFAFTTEVDGSRSSISYGDGCLVMDIDGEREEMCSEDIAEQMESFGLGGLGSFDWGDGAGFVVREVDGKWFVDPFASYTDTMLSAMRAIDRGDIEEFIEQIKSLAAPFLGTSQLMEEDFEFEEEFAEPTVFPDDTTFDFETTLPGDEGLVPLETVPDEEGTGDEDPFSKCFESSDYNQCLLDAVAAGELTEDMLPIDVRYPECFGDYYQVSYELDDAAFIARVNEISACMQPAIEAGEVDEFVLPAEIAAPQCVTLNPYNFDTAPEDAFEKLYDCYLAES